MHLRLPGYGDGGPTIFGKPPVGTTPRRVIVPGLATMPSPWTTYRRSDAVLAAGGSAVGEVDFPAVRGGASTFVYSPTPRASDRTSAVGRRRSLSTVKT